MVDRFEQFSALISAAYRQVQKIERAEMEKYGLKGAYAQYLRILTRFPEGMTAAQLVEIGDRDKAAISRVVAEMEEKGLVKRLTAGNHQYRAAIVLTAEGRRAAEYVAERATAIVSKAVEGLTDEARSAMYASLELICSNLQNITANEE
jgi:DNA-binding MarR family transcriptional regulator